MIEILPAADGSRDPGSSAAADAPRPDGRQEAVLDALAKLSADPAIAIAGAEPNVIRDACDLTAFAGCEKSGSLLRAVTRALDALASGPSRLVAKADRRYRLVIRTQPPTVLQGPDLFSLGIAAE